MLSVKVPLAQCGQMKTMGFLLYNEPAGRRCVRPDFLYRVFLLTPPIMFRDFAAAESLPSLHFNEPNDVGWLARLRIRTSRKPAPPDISINLN